MYLCLGLNLELCESGGTKFQARFFLQVFPCYDSAIGLVPKLQSRSLPVDKF
jgi:hypothetical protein